MSSKMLTRLGTLSLSPHSIRLPFSYHFLLSNKKLISLRSFSSTKILISPQIRRQRRRFILSIILKSGLVLTLTSLLGTTYFIYTNEGMYRATYFWFKLFPVYLHYRITQSRIKDLPAEEQKKIWDELHTKYCHVAFNVVLHLRGFYIKLAQMGAVRDDFVPKQYIDLLKTAQDKCPAEEGKIIRQRVIESLKLKNIEEVFIEFDNEPCGSASIGQTHRARLKSNGQEVAVKVMDPRAENHFRWDIATLKRFCKLAQPVHLGMLEAIERQFLTEFDYRKEGQNLEDICTNLSKAKGKYKWIKEKFIVPRPIKELTTENVLVMTFIPGIKLISGIINRHKELAAQRGMTLEQLEKENKTPKTSSQMKQIASSLQFYDSLYNIPTWLYNWTLVPILRLKPKPYYESIIPLNIPDIINDLMLVHGYEIFMDGCFNGDPHPGNILLLPDGERMGLIDYGSVARLSKENRVKFAKLIIALAARKEKEVVRIYAEEMGFKTKHMDPYCINLYATIAYDRDDFSVTGDKNVQMFLETLGKRDPITFIPREFILAHRASTLLKGFSYAFKLPVSVARVWEPIAKDFLLQEGIKYEP